MQNANYVNKQFCGNCGMVLDENAEFCGNCGYSISKNNTQQPRQVSNKAQTSIQETPSPQKKSSSKIIVVLVLIILLLISSFVGYVAYNNSKIEKDTHVVSSVQTEKKKDAEPISKDEPSPTTKEKAEAKVGNISENTDLQIDNKIENVSEQVSYIRNAYYEIQNSLQTLKTINDGEITKYYRNNKVVRLDISSGTIDNYTRFYYFDNEKLIFVFCFDGNKENRLYFKDNVLFRWIDENGNTHDNEFNNTDFMDLKTQTLNYLNMYK